MDLLTKTKTCDWVNDRNGLKLESELCSIIVAPHFWDHYKIFASAAFFFLFCTTFTSFFWSHRSEKKSKLWLWHHEGESNSQNDDIITVHLMEKRNASFSFPGMGDNLMSEGLFGERWGVGDGEEERWKEGQQRVATPTTQLSSRGKKTKNAGAHANVRKCSESCSTAEVQQAAGETQQLLPHIKKQVKKNCTQLNDDYVIMAEANTAAA